MRFSIDKNLIINSLLVPMLVMVATFLLSYFFYFQPQIQLLKNQLDAQLQSLETQQQGQEIDVVRAGFELLQQRVDVKYPYAPDDPAFAEIESYAITAWQAIAEGDTNKAKSLIGKAFETLATVGGPPTVDTFVEWDTVKWRREQGFQ